jgi:flagellar hook-associated protein 2
MAISSPGIGSNIDVNGIVGQLMAVERRPLAALDRREASFQAQLSAYGSLRGALASLKTAADALDDPSRFLATSLSSSDTAVLTGSAGAASPRGTYTVQVDQLARRQSIVAAGQASADSAIGSGASTTLTIQRGTISGGTLTSGIYSAATFTPDAGAPAGTVTITAANNTLTGIRDAINQANLGVTASIVRDGSAAPYRLVLQGATTGAAGSVRVSVSGDATLAGLLAYDPAGTQNLTQTTAAQDAKLVVNGVPVTSRSNVVSDILDGVSLTLAKAGTTTVTIGNATAAVTQSVQELVKAYNDFNKTLTELSRSDPARQNSGVLVGDAAARTLQAQLRATLSASLPAAAQGDLRNLNQAGLSFQRDGSLSLDTARLQSALNADPEAVSRLFASGARAADPQLRIVSTGAKTTPGSYAVNASALPAQGSFAGSAAAALTITAGVNDSLDVSVDGTSTGVTIPAGTYTTAGLAAQVQASINGSSTLAAAKAAVSVSESAGVLTVRSLRFGATSSVTITGSGASDLFGISPVAAKGTDVAGTIGGTVATGEGRRLSAASGSGADGLVLEVTGGTAGERGTVLFSRGFAWRLNEQLDTILGSGGVLAARSDGINRSIRDIERQRENLARRLETVEQRFRAQFTALDSLVSNLLSTSNFLNQQLATLNNNQSR